MNSIKRGLDVWRWSHGNSGWVGVEIQLTAFRTSLFSGKLWKRNLNRISAAVFPLLLAINVLILACRFCGYVFFHGSSSHVETLSLRLVARYTFECAIVARNLDCAMRERER